MYIHMYIYYICVYINIYMYMCKRGRDRNTDIFHLLLTPQMAALARTGPRQCQEQRLLQFCGSAGAQTRGPSSFAFPRSFAGSWAEMEQSGFELASLWDANAARGGFTQIDFKMYLLSEKENSSLRSGPVSFVSGFAFNSQPLYTQVFLGDFTLICCGQQTLQIIKPDDGTVLCLFRRK